MDKTCIGQASQKQLVGITLKVPLGLKIFLDQNTTFFTSYTFFSCDVTVYDTKICKVGCTL